MFTYTGSHDASSVSGSPLAGKLFIVIGAGGAGKALAYGAKEKGARVVIANCTYGSVLALYLFLHFFFPEESRAIIVIRFMIHRTFYICSIIVCIVILFN